MATNKQRRGDPFTGKSLNKVKTRRRRLFGVGRATGLSAVAKCQKKGGKWVKGKCVTSSGKETKAMPSSRGYSK